MTILDRIVASKQQEIARAGRNAASATWSADLAQAPPLRNFRAALEAGTGVRIIAEVKKASPSAGVIRADFDPVAIARIYEAHGAACVSVLTDEPFFQGRLEYLRQSRQAIALPLLRKDFILDRYQLLQARLAGADAVLLIAEVLDDDQLAHLQREAAALGLQTLVDATTAPICRASWPAAPGSSASTTAICAVLSRAWSTLWSWRPGCLKTSAW